MLAFLIGLLWCLFVMLACSLWFCWFAVISVYSLWMSVYCQRKRARESIKALWDSCQWNKNGFLSLMVIDVCFLSLWCGILVSEIEGVFSLFSLWFWDLSVTQYMGESCWLRGENCQSVHWTAGVHSGILAVTPLGLLSTLILSIKRDPLCKKKKRQHNTI